MRRIKLLKGRFYLKRYKMRHLREYHSVANRTHFCDNCCRYIQPGEQYVGEVYANKNGIIVSKQHSNPACDFPWDEEEELLKSSNLESSVREDIPSSLAA
jgi:hypothetical protein